MNKQTDKKHYITLQHFVGDGWYSQQYVVNDSKSHYWDNSYGIWVKLSKDQKEKIKR